MTAFERTGEAKPGRTGADDNKIVIHSTRTSLKCICPDKTGCINASFPGINSLRVDKKLPEIGAGFWPKDGKSAKGFYLSPGPYRSAIL
jgi:hypothetical protein